MIDTRTRVRMRIEEYGIVPAIRPDRGPTALDDALFAAETLNSAGIPIAEISMSIPGAIAVIAHLTKIFPKLIVGADVLDVETAHRCMDAGAKFLTSAGLFPEVVEFATKHELVVFPGALTPTEVVIAWNTGADYVKVFPCAQVGGAGYIKALRGPLPDIPLIASGGVNQHTAASFMRAGAIAVGIGAELLPPDALRARREEQIVELARRFLAMVKNGRAERMQES